MDKKRNIIFIGIMGSGKTTIGKKIARNLNYDFIDTDHEIENITGMSIPDLFKKEGELRFRSEETHALKRIENKNPAVISTGAGIILKKQNREIIKNLGIIVFLDADVETIIERVSRNTNRPLLKVDNLEEKVRVLISERRELYLEIADIIIDTGSDRFENIINITEKKIRNFKK